MSTDDQLLKSYAQKLKSGKKPTSAESKAFQRHTEKRIVDQLRACQPAFFNELFAVQNKQRYDWSDRYQFPCGKGLKTIDSLAVIKAFKDLIAQNRKYLGTGSGGRKQNDDDVDIQEAKRQEIIERKKKTVLQREKIEIEVAILKRESIPIEDVRECFESLSAVWTRISKQLQKSGQTDAWNIVEAGLTEARNRFDEEMAVDPQLAKALDAEIAKLSKEETDGDDD